MSPVTFVFYLFVGPYTPTTPSPGKYSTSYLFMSVFVVAFYVQKNLVVWTVDWSCKQLRDCLITDINRPFPHSKVQKRQVEVSVDKNTRNKLNMLVKLLKIKVQLVTFFPLF